MFDTSQFQTDFETGNGMKESDCFEKWEGPGEEGGALLVTFVRVASCMRKYNREGLSLSSFGAFFDASGSDNCLALSLGDCCSEGGCGDELACRTLSGFS